MIERFDEIFDKITKSHDIPAGHIYSRRSLKELCFLIVCELREIEEKDTEAGMIKMGFTPVEINETKQFEYCSKCRSKCPDGCYAFIKGQPKEERQKFLENYPNGCHSKWDLHYVGEGLGDWEGIYKGEPLIFGNNIRELIWAFKLWWNSK